MLSSITTFCPGCFAVANLATNIFIKASILWILVIFPAWLSAKCQACSSSWNRFRVMILEIWLRYRQLFDQYLAILGKWTSPIHKSRPKMHFISLGLVSVHFVNGDYCFRLPEWSTCWAYRLVSVTICSITSPSQNNLKKSTALCVSSGTLLCIDSHSTHLKCFWRFWTLCLSFNGLLHTNSVSSAVWSKSFWFVLSSESVCSDSDEHRQHDLDFHILVTNPKYLGWQWSILPWETILSLIYHYIQTETSRRFSKNSLLSCRPT